MSFFKSLSSGLEGFFENITTPVEEAILGKKLGKKTQDEIFRPPEKVRRTALGLDEIIVGGAVIALSGGTLGPEVVAAEAAQIATIEAAEVIGAEVAATEFAAVSGAEAIGLSEPLLAEATAAELAATEATGVLEIEELGAELGLEEIAVDVEQTISQQTGLSGGRFLGALEKSGKILARASTVIGIGTTIIDLVETVKLQKDEETLQEQIKNIGSTIGVGAGVIGAITGKDISAIEQFAEQIETVGSQIGQVKEGLEKFEDLTNKEINQLKDLEIAEVEKIEGVIQKDFSELQQEFQTQQIQEQHFEQKLLARVEAEEKELVGVIDDLAERLEESFIKDFDFESMLDLMNRLESDDIVDFLSRNLDDFNKLSVIEKNTILDLGIQKGL